MQHVGEMVPVVHAERIFEDLTVPRGELFVDDHDGGVRQAGPRIVDFPGTDIEAGMGSRGADQHGALLGLPDLEQR